MTEGMPDFAMPSEEELARQRAQAEDDAREASARAALVDERGEATADVPPTLASAPVRAPSAVASPARRRILAIVRNPVVTFVAGAALVAAAFVAVPAIQRQAEEGSLAELDRVVADYVSAIESGDLETASRMAPPDAAYAEDSLLDAVRTAAPAFTCADPNVDGDVATVSCGVSVPTFGAGAPIRMRLVRDGGWRIETGLAVASPLFVTLARVDAIGGAALPDGVDLLEDPIWLYPGVYDLEVTTSPRLDVEGTELAVLGDGFLWFGGASPDPAMLDEMRTAALDYVTACAETAAAGCPEVAPLGPGERFEALGDGYTTSSGSLEVVLGVLVRRVGGAPDQWGIDVRAVFEEDLQSYTVVPSVPSF